ncbi:MAG: glutamyl-tRNA reductase [Thiotrichales bacterium]|nr:glutamyl-tRNA reductase [Thiotrichales bacterium]
MTALIAIGINHKTAPLEVRERVAFAPERMVDALHEIIGKTPASEASILSTCNRTELLCSAEPSDSEHIISWFRDYHGLTQEEVEPYLYVFPAHNAVRHLMRVASGLDSMVLGEPQILGQVKDAYSSAQEAGTAGRMLNGVYQHVFSVAKQVRTDTAIGSSPVSVAFAAVSLAKQLFSNFEKHTALLIGAGETIELTAKHLSEAGMGNLIIANRTLERAQKLTRSLGGKAITLAEMPDHLKHADIIISSTASQLPILGKGAVERALKQRKHKPILMIDIAVPRDIEPEVNQLDDIYLYSVDDLQEIINEGLRSRQQAAEQAEEIINVQVIHFNGWLQSLDAGLTIGTYRQNAEQLRDDELQKALQLIERGVNADEVIKRFAYNLTNKLIHHPSSQMKKASYEGRNNVIDIARELLGIKDLDN